MSYLLHNIHQIATRANPAVFYSFSFSISFVLIAVFRGISPFYKYQSGRRIDNICHRYRGKSGLVYSAVYEMRVPLAAQVSPTAPLLYFHQLMQTTCKAPGCVGAQIAGFRVAATSNICRRNRRDESYSKARITGARCTYVEFSTRTSRYILYNYLCNEIKRSVETYEYSEGS